MVEQANHLPFVFPASCRYPGRIPLRRQGASHKRSITRYPRSRREAGKT